MVAVEELWRSMSGLSEIEFREHFGTEEACRKALFDMRWREGLTCPACGHRGFCALKTRQLFQCNRFRNGPLGVKSPSDCLIAGFTLPSVVCTVAATPCSQIREASGTI